MWLDECKGQGRRHKRGSANWRVGTRTQRRSIVCVGSDVGGDTTGYYGAAEERGKTRRGKSEDQTL